MNALKMCLNWKVLVGLGAVGLAVFIVAPGLIGAVLPALFVLACPLSMVAMMVGMGRMGRSDQPSPSASGAMQASREERLAQLQAELSDIGDRQVALTREVERLQNGNDDAAATASGHSGPDVPVASHLRS